MRRELVPDGQALVDMVKPRMPERRGVGSLFTGLGGLDLAAQAVFDLPLNWYSEINTRVLKALGHHWSEAESLGDASMVSWDAVMPVSVLTGGFPCQDISNAGRMAGLSGARSGLWYSMVEAISAMRPDLVVIENVRGLSSAQGSFMGEQYQHMGSGRNRALGTVLGCLADLGYDAQWALTPASAVGAPHERNRFMVIAWPQGTAPYNLRKRRGRHWEAFGWQTENGGIARTRTSVTPEDFGPYEDAIALWESYMGRAVPVPLEDSGRRIRVTTEFYGWVMGFPAGLTEDNMSWTASIQAYGNAVVPQWAYETLQALLDQVELEQTGVLSC